MASKLGVAFFMSIVRFLFSRDKEEEGIDLHRENFQHGGHVLLLGSRHSARISGSVCLNHDAYC